MAINNNYLVLAIYDDKIELLEFSHNLKNLIVQNFGRIELPAGIVESGRIIDPELLFGKLQEALAKSVPNRITAKEVILLLNNDLIFNHVFNFVGDLDQDYLLSMIPSEAEKIVPYNRDDVYWDFITKSKTTQNGYTTIQYNAVSREVIESYSGLLSRLELSPLLVTSRYEAYKTLVKKEKDVEDSIVVMELNKHSIKLICIEQNIIECVKIIDFDEHKFIESIASQIKPNDTEHELDHCEYLDSIIEQLKNEIAQEACYEMSDNIYVWGDKLTDQYLFKYLRKKIPKHLKVHTIWNPIVLGRELDHDKEAVAFINQNKIDFGILAAVGAVYIFNPTIQPVNLLPFEQRRSASANLLGGVLPLVGLLTIGINVGIVVLLTIYSLNFHFNLQERTQQTKNFEELIYGTRYEQLKSDIISFNKEVNKLYELNGTIVNLPEVYSQVLALGGEAIKLQSVSYLKDSGELQVDGSAKTRGDLLTFKSKIDSLSGIVEIDFPLSNLDKSEDIIFQIKIKLTPETK